MQQPGNGMQDSVPVPEVSDRGVRLNRLHEEMMYLILANPVITRKELVERMNRSYSWVHNALNAPAFQKMLRENAKEIHDFTIIASIEDRLRGVVSRTVELLEERLEQPGSELTDQFLLETFKASSKSLGMGPQTGNQTNVQVNIDAHLETLGNNLTKLLYRRKHEAESPEPIEAKP